MSKQKLAIADIETRFQNVNKNFIPYPATYINGERWNDEPIDSEVEESIFKHAEISMQ